MQGVLTKQGIIVNIKDISPRRAAQNAAFQALPIAKVIRPLRFIFEAHDVRHKRNHDAESKVLPFNVAVARSNARAGNGGAVQRAAMRLVA